MNHPISRKHRSMNSSLTSLIALRRRLIFVMPSHTELSSAIGRNWLRSPSRSLTALQQNRIGEGRVWRAKKALTTLLTSMVLDDKETANTSNHGKQIQAMSSNLAAPRGGESTSLAMPVYIVSTVLVFVMGALVEAIPC